jgi:hypothetical protein
MATALPVRVSLPDEAEAFDDVAADSVPALLAAWFESVPELSVGGVGGGEYAELAGFCSELQAKHKAEVDANTSKEPRKNDRDMK